MIRKNTLVCSGYLLLWRVLEKCFLLSQSRKYLPQHRNYLRLIFLHLKQHCFNSEHMVKNILGLFCSKTGLLTV